MPLDPTQEPIFPPELLVGDAPRAPGDLLGPTRTHWGLCVLLVL